MPKKITEYQLLPLFRKYINSIKKGKHLQNNGKKIKSASIDNYLYLEKLLTDFCSAKGFNLRIRPIAVYSQKQFNDEKKYWKEFYLSFTNYLYDDLGHFDNYVGSTIKLLKAFFNFLNTQAGIPTGAFYKKFFTPSEEIEIIVLSPERVKNLINNKDLENRLSSDLQEVKDVFVFGCAVALRYSDLMALNSANIEIHTGVTYIKMQSKKTQTFTRVKLPPHAIEILEKYKARSKTGLLPKFNKAYLNKKIKLLMQEAGYTEPVNRYRQRRGIPVKIYKNEKRKIAYRFCDIVTTHTMRRTAITNLLSSGMSEQAVRRISGHAANSKEFYRYVSFAQTYMDHEIDKAHEKLYTNALT